MKTRNLIGIILLLISVVSCVDLTTDESRDYAPYGYHYKEFGMGATKSVTTVSWVTGDKICMYSLDKDNLILYKDTVEITDINRNAGKIKALVDNKSDRYFAVYPFNAIKSEIGETLDDEDFRINLTGNFSDVSVMSEYVDTAATSIYMQDRFALLDLKTKNYYGTVEIDSSYPSTSTVTRGNGDYWIPISFKNEDVTVTVRKPSGRKDIVYSATFKVKPGEIYEK